MDCRIKSGNDGEVGCIQPLRVPYRVGAWVTTLGSSNFLC